MTRWNLVVDDKTDQRLRAFLGQQGAKKGDLSKFVEQAVLDRIFAKTTNTIKERNSKYNQQDINDTIEDTVETIRANRS